jgi:leucyl aminopeptidase
MLLAARAPAALRPLRRVFAARAAASSPFALAELPEPVGFSFARDDSQLGNVQLVALAVRAADVGGPAWAAWDSLLGGELSALTSELSDDASWDAAKPVSGRLPLGQRLYVHGLGKSPTGASLKAFAAAAGAHARAVQVERMRLVVLGAEGELPEAALSALVCGVNVGCFDDSRFKSKSPPAGRRRLADVSLSQPVAGLEGVMTGASLAGGTLLCRQLVNAPPNVATPTALAAAASELAARYPDVLSLKLLDAAACQQRGMGAFLGVAAASDEPPVLIHLTYTPRGGAREGAPPLALVGKGLTFDSGGYNVKAGAGSMIELMKFDMGGAAACLGAARSIAELEPSGSAVHFIVASCENMIGSRGLRPGDILRCASGATVEVNNTDAEGRLTLADALHYAQGPECGARRVVDIATLTGACMVALGTGMAGMWSPSDALAEELRAAGEAQEEKLWRMPLEHSYWEQMSSPLADMKNTGMGKGGAITAALFLSKFINDGVEWAHLDIAGPVWAEKEGQATGFGAALLAQWVLAQSKVKRPAA